MKRPRLEVADIFRRYGRAFRESPDRPLSDLQQRVMSAIQQCRTAALGGQIEQCGSCGHRRYCYRSCRNRHCPKCQFAARAQWVEQRCAELLACPYFHLVFTVPREVAAIALQNKRVTLSILFRAATRALREIAADPAHLGAQISGLAVMHTWGQCLQFHPVVVHIPWVKNGCVFSLWLQSAADRFAINLKNPSPAAASNGSGCAAFA
ncbi:MAG: transposase zinc-binding domain-containing protein [Bryobacterales bacterium]|nr:transposase zinc-binding domain-containing protein [Bryobacterales bacterium]